MRSSTAFVLATLAVGQAAAGTHRHASFHHRRSNPAQDKVEIDVGKRAYDTTNVDWTKALEGVDWSKVNYGASSTTPEAAPSSTAAPSAASSVASVYVADVKPSSSSTPAPTSTPTPTPTSSSVAAATTTTKAAKTSEKTTDVVGALLEAVDKALLLALGFAGCATNPTTSTGNAYVNAEGPYVQEVSNQSGEDLIYVCWDGASSWVNKFVPTITVSIASGSTQSISFSDSFSGACSAVYADTELVNGQISNTWLEATFGEWGTYDVSKEVNMSGRGISAVGPSCTSDMNTCVFECTSGNSCMTGYTLKNCAQGAVGTASDGGASGGCQGLGSGATLKVTLS